MRAQRIIIVRCALFISKVLDSQVRISVQFVTKVTMGLDHVIGNGKSQRLSVDYVVT